MPVVVRDSRVADGGGEECARARDGVLGARSAQAPTAAGAVTGKNDVV